MAKKTTDNSAFIEEAKNAPESPVMEDNLIDSIPLDTAPEGVAPEGVAPEQKEPPLDNKDKPQTSIVSKGRAGKIIFAVTGKPIVFDDEGKAEVSPEDYLYLSKISGFSK